MGFPAEGALLKAIWLSWPWIWQSQSDTADALKRKPYGFDGMPRSKIDGVMTSFKLDGDLRAMILSEFGKQGMAAYLRRVVRGDMEARGRLSRSIAEALPDTEPELRKKRSPRAPGPYMKQHPAYTAWCSMKDKSRQSGVPIHPAWRDFWAFGRDMGSKPEGAVLKRHDATRPWGPDNCVWGTYRQANHGRNVVMTFVVGGRVRTLPDLAEESGVPYATLYARIRKGWPLERALSEPIRPGPGKPRKPGAAVRELIPA